MQRVHLQVEHGKLKKLNQESDQLTEWMEQRFFWPDVLTELRRGVMELQLPIPTDLQWQAAWQSVSHGV